VNNPALLAPELASIRGFYVTIYPPSSSLHGAVEVQGEPLEKLQLTSNVPPWLPGVVDQLQELSHLPPNWDSYGGQPVKARSLRKALVVLSMVMGENSEPPWIVPLPDGGIQFEWHRPELELEITINGEDASLVVADDDEYWETIPADETWRPLFALQGRIPPANPD
jgi:hypothetical protein